MKPYYSDESVTLYHGEALATCPAAASWVPREGQARVIHLPEPRTT